MSSKRLTESGIKLILLVVATSVAGGLLALPRPVSPKEWPALQLDPREQKTAPAADSERASGAPSGDAVTRLHELFDEQGVKEAEGGARHGQQRRLQQLRATLQEIRQRHGGEAVDALRVRATGRAVRALAGELPTRERRAALGRFVDTLERYEVMREGARVAPLLVVRSLYKARWNALAGLELTAGLHPVERRAYWGWLALHASRAPMGHRRDALDRYEELGGAGVPEARGVLAFEQGHYGTAAQWLGRAHEAGGSLRLRNHHVAALEASR